MPSKFFSILIGILLILTVGFSLFNKLGNKNNSPRAVEEQTAHDTIPNSFKVFYARFHEDSIYQLEHIAFPLQGIPSIENSDSIPDFSDFRWEKESWKIHRNLPIMEEFVKQYSFITPNVIEETIKHRDYDFGMVRRFSKLANEWNLIYYEAMNPL